ncbi:MAG: hypothetical protein AAGN46_03935 [Acidobacteriota bacterium]
MAHSIRRGRPTGDHASALSRRGLRRCFRIFLICLASIAPVLPAAAWTPETQRRLGEQAARLAPPDLYRQLVRNRDAFRVGLAEPRRQGRGADHASDEGTRRATIESAVDDAILSIRAHRPFNEVAYRLGLVAHHLTVANDPSHARRDDPAHARWARDYPLYAESALPRVAMVFYGFRAGDRRLVLDRLLADTSQRSAELYPLLGREYRRVGYAPGRRSFDDRSTAYAVTALGMSHAVSDIAEVLRYIWLEAGGIDTRSHLPRRGHQWVRLEPLRAPAANR